MKSFSPEELASIIQRIANTEGLWLPLEPSATQTSPSGPDVSLMLRYSDLFPNALDVEGRYWQALQNVPILGAVGVLGDVNRILTEGRTHDPEVNRQINERLVTPELLAKVQEYIFQPVGRGFAAIFTRTGCLQVMRHLIVYGGDLSITEAGASENRLGELILLGNQFLQADVQLDPNRSSTLELLLAILPEWDLHNPRDLAYSLCRMFRILTEILPGDDPTVQSLLSRIRLNPADLKIDGQSLGDFIAVVFGLYAYGRKMEPPSSSRFDVQSVFSRVAFPVSILEQFTNARSLSVSRFRERLSPRDGDSEPVFREELRARRFLTESLNAFRKFPLLEIGPGNMVILDLQFLVDLLSSGIYWTIFDSLHESARDSFRELWGRLFEVYVVKLLEEHYPTISGILISDLKFLNGQIDALLDFGDFVIVIEAKASLLTEAAKRSTDMQQFLADFRRKFVRNERDKPKVIPQLITSCRAIEGRQIRTASESPRIYPVFVSDEPSVECLFFNSYMNEEFWKEVPSGSRFQPISVMSISELEEALPYFGSGALGWEEVLQRRFAGSAVTPFSVHQTVFDLAQEKGVARQRGEFMKDRFDTIWASTLKRYQSPRPPSA